MNQKGKKGLIHPQAVIEKSATIGKNTVVGPYCFLQQKTRVGRNCILYAFINLYGCTIGDNTKIGAFSEVGRGVKVGKSCKIQTHTFVCEGVTIDEEVFLGMGVRFMNDRRPRATNSRSRPKSRKDWQLEKTFVEKGVSIGSNSVIWPVRIGKFAMVGAGSLITRDLPPYALAYGSPARIRGYVCPCGQKLKKIRKKTPAFTYYQCSNCKKKIRIKDESSKS